MLRTDCPAVLGLVARRTTRCAHCVRYAQTGCDKSVDVARCARGPQGLCSSAPRRRAATCPGAPLRDAVVVCGGTPPQLDFAAGGTRQGRFVGRRGAQGWGRRAQRASWADSPHLSERSERSERSELCGATPGRAPQRSRQRSADRSTMSPCRVPPAAIRTSSDRCRHSPTAATGRLMVTPKAGVNAWFVMRHVTWVWGSHLSSRSTARTGDASAVLSLRGRAISS